MIKRIHIKNFKSLKDIELPCSNLNLLTGMDGSGKSSVFQALLLLRQSHLSNQSIQSGFKLNGDLVEIGDMEDALSIDSEGNELIFEISFDNEPCIYKWVVKQVDNNESKDDVKSDSDVLTCSTNANSEIDLNSLSLFNCNFQYLNAERWVRDQYPLSDYSVIQNRNLGKHGEFAAHYLEYFGMKSSALVAEELLCPGTEVRTLDFQVSAWMNEIFPGALINVKKIVGQDNIGLSYGKEKFKPSNVGYGITYVLPIIVALLSAKKGDILVIENPELHIYPMSQAVIIRLITLTAERGVQIFLETNSDHILNGTMVSIHQKNMGFLNGINSEQVKIYFFDKCDNRSNVSLISVSEDGRIGDVPEGFFDQSVKDLRVILGFC